MPFGVDPRFIASMLRELEGVDGYMATKAFTVAAFSSKFEGGKVQVQKNMHKAFKEGEAVFVIVMTQRPSKQEIEAQEKTKAYAEIAKGLKDGLRRSDTT